MQDKRAEMRFFDQFSEGDEYNVFSEATNRRIVNTCADWGGFTAGMTVLDLGCGSGIFSEILRARGVKVIALDISHGLTALGRRKYPGVQFVTGDVEHLPFPSASADGVTMFGIVHHLPDPSTFARETFRVLKPGGAFVAFDPNRRNPFMYLYRDRSSPFYSSKGVTENERPVLAEQVATVFAQAGFKTEIDYLSDLHYRYIASPVMRLALPLYNQLDTVLFRPEFMKSFRSFVLTKGVKA